MDQTNHVLPEQPNGRPRETPRAFLAIALEATRAQSALASEAFAQVAATLAQSGLSLSEQDLAELEAARAGALARSERVEFGAPPIASVAEELAESPFLLRENLLDALAEAQECFYRLREETGHDFTDEDLARALAQRFDAAEGDLDALAATEAADIASLLDDGAGDSSEPADLEYRITDDEGDEYVFRLEDWEYDEHALGWDGEEWGGDLDE